jgi:predicted Kef-type K+ transport protein
VNGRIAVGWLVVEDLAMVLVLVLLPALAPLLGGTDARPGGRGACGLTLASRWPRSAPSSR